MGCVLITGTSSGIGRATADRFAEEGWRVVGTSRTPRRPAGAAEAGRVVTERLDLSEPSSIPRFAQRVMEAHGIPDVLVNSAGTMLFGPVEDTELADAERLFRVNLFGTMELVKALAPHMRDRGSGTIVNISSVGGRVAIPFFTLYAASKFALEALTEGLWHELHPFGIRVKAVEPGLVDTPIYAAAMRADGSRERPSPPYRPYEGRVAGFVEAKKNRSDPHEVAEAVWEAANDESDRLRYPVAAYAGVLLRSGRLLGEEFVRKRVHEKLVSP